MPHADRPVRRHGRTWHDGKAPDGFTVNGWRRIAKGGYVRFLGTRHYHEKFTDWAGLWVFAEVADGWAVNLNVWPDQPWKDSRTMLRCTNETDWYANAPVTPAAGAREVSTTSM